MPHKEQVRLKNNCEGAGHDLIRSENPSPAWTEGSRGETRKLISTGSLGSRWG